MASGMSGAANLPDRDYSESHRVPPIPSLPYTESQAGQAPVISHEPGRPIGRTKSNTNGDAASTTSGGRKRRGSFKFLRRSSSNTNAPTPPPPALPPLASPRNTDVDGGSSNSSTHQHQRAQSTPLGSIGTYNERKASGEAGMLRKHSKQRQQQAALDQERLQREAQQQSLSRSPPRLPSHNPLPQMTSFGGEEAAAYAVPGNSNINNNFYHQQNAYTDAGVPPAIPGQPYHTHNTSNNNHSYNHNNNFSRPKVGMPAYHNYNDSSSPSYLARSGNAFAQQSSFSPGVRSGDVNGQYVDPMPRSESMTNRGRYSYASSTAPVSVNSPRRIRRRKDPAPFNVLVVGAKNSGKSSFINFLRHSLAPPPGKQAAAEMTFDDPATTHASRTSFTAHYLETEIDSERVGLTLWDSAGLEKNVADLQLREVVSFIESKFQETFNEEQKITRSPGVKDTHIHCVLVMLDPIRLDATVAASDAFTKGAVNLTNAHGLDDEFDLQVFRALWGKTTVIPVIAKADTLTVGHMAFLKRAVWASLQGAKLDPLEALGLEGDEEDDGSEEDETDSDAQSADLNNDSQDVLSNDTASPRSNRRSHMHNFSRASIASVKSASNDGELPYLPMTVISPDPYELPPYVPKSKASKHPDKVGRRYPWGLADPYNTDHCDFNRLRDSIFLEWRTELRDLSKSKWYENWRTSRLKTFPGSRQRVKGGVTPVAAVPREGRTSPQDIRSFTPASGFPQQQIQSTPRSVSRATQQQQQSFDEPVGVAVTTPGLNDTKVSMGSSAGPYR